jgi:DNA (cytosine-5)-methyltransferase 1
MSKKYSEIKEKLKIVVDKNTTNEMAHLTYYFENHNNGVSDYYKPNAKEYLAELHANLEIAQEPDFHYYLPIKWDVPFPLVKNPKFKFSFR